MIRTLLMLVIFLVTLNPAAAFNPSATGTVHRQSISRASGPHLQAESNVVTASGTFAEVPKEGLLVDAEYSKVLIQDNGPVRTLYGILEDDQGNMEGTIESSMNMSEPSKLTLLQFRYIMSSVERLTPAPKRALVVGLGGGAMIHYLSAKYPDLTIDIVEIDSKIAELAVSHFGIQPSDRIHIHIEDGFDFLEKAENTYDLIFMDAFLPPSKDTDAAGKPLRMKRLSFYERIFELLNDKGSASINLSVQEEMQADVAVIKKAFPRAWPVKEFINGNLMVIVAHDPEGPGHEGMDKFAELIAAAEAAVPFGRK